MPPWDWPLGGAGHAARPRRSLALASDGSFTYTPIADYRGLDAFTYRVYDGALDSNNVTVSLTITPVDDDVALADGDLPQCQRGHCRR